MHSAIFVANFPDDPNIWNNYVDEVRVKTTDKGVVRIAVNVWLVNTQQSINFLG